MSPEPNLVYQGQGRKALGVAADAAPDTSPEAPAGYIAGSRLADAVNTAIFLQQPLLVMGEPGTGKTQLAASIAWELGLPLHRFNTKMNSAGNDLFYRYDSLLHFHDTQILKTTQESLTKYVQYAALGKAILHSNPPSAVSQYLSEAARKEHLAALRSVVLIDEIDKAPRDFPNDILAETEDLSFTVRETGWTIKANPALKPIVIFTSNQERNLPDAFLRRCIYYYIPFPTEADLLDISRRRLTGPQTAAIRKFLDIRKDDKLIKKPATAELLAWLRLLENRKIDQSEISSETDRVRATYTVLLKNREDLERYHGGSDNGTAKIAAK